MTDDRDEGLEQRRKRLAAELADKRADDAAGVARATQSEESRKGMALGLKISSEFIAAVAVGAMLGYLLGLVWPASKPWGLIILLLLGFCAGVLNVLRAVGMVAPSPSLGPNAEDKTRNGS